MKLVLVVDDEPTIRELIADVLAEWGYRVETAANGTAALQLMSRQLPDAIVLDLMMPRLNGTGFIQLKRLNPRFDPIPILLVTAAFGAAEAAEQLGAQACLTKPFELDDLVAVVDRLVGQPPPGSHQLPSMVSIQRSFVAES